MLRTNTKKSSHLHFITLPKEAEIIPADEAGQKLMKDKAIGRTIAGCFDHDPNLAVTGVTHLSDSTIYTIDYFSEMGRHIQYVLTVRKEGAESC